MSGSATSPDPRHTPTPERESPRTPHVLFVPVTGGSGLGEYVRSLTIAEAVQQRWPRARIRFLLSHGAPRIENNDFECVWLERSPTHESAAVIDTLRRDPPDIAIFDNAGRRAQLEQARRVGASTVFIASRFNKRRKGFRLRYLSELDQLWIVGSRVVSQGFSAWEQLKLRLAPGVEVISMESIFPESVPERRRLLERRLGLSGRPFVLFVAGGGGWTQSGRSISEIFAEAASLVGERSDVATVVVMGPMYRGQVRERPNTTVVSHLSPTELVDLIHDAHLLVLGGGSIIGQGLAHGRVCVAAPAGGSDQQRRVRGLARRGLIESAAPHPTELAGAVGSLLDDAQRFREIEARVRDLGVANGLAGALAGLERLIVKRESHGRQAPSRTALPADPYPSPPSGGIESE